MSNPSDTRIDQLGAALGQPASTPATPPAARPARTTRPATPAASSTPVSASAAAPTANPSAASGSASNGSASTEDDHEGEGRSPAPETPMPPFVKRMPLLIQDLWKKGVQFNLDSRSGDFLVEGFYSNGPLRLTEQDDGMLAVDKRGRKEKVASFDDLARINFRWWRLSTDKDRYIAPQRPWIDAFNQNKWVTRKVIFVPADDTGDNNLPS